MVTEHDPLPERSATRQMVASLVIVTAVCLILGHTIRQPSLMAANDISRWCTVWSLLERGSYIIDECPWQLETQDKILTAVGPAKPGMALDFGDGKSEPRVAGVGTPPPEELALDPRRHDLQNRKPHPARPDTGEGASATPVKHYYSSKPALLPTLIAGVLYPFRKLIGVPIDSVVLQPRAQRSVLRRDPADATRLIAVTETPTDPVKWPAYPFYFKPVLILFNVIPYALFLILFARVLDRHAADDGVWFFSLVAAAFGTYLLPFLQTLNNHTLAALSAFFALYQFLRIWDEREPATWRFGVAGFFAAFTATNELPALSFTMLLGAVLLVRFPRQAIVAFAPGAAVPLLAFVAAQFAVFGKFRLAYEGFGGSDYLYEGSFWNTPLDLDALNKTPESYAVYLFHMTLGHHGFWSLTPILLLSLLGAGRLLVSRGGTAARSDQRVPGMSALAAMSLVLTIVMLAFYTWNPRARNYGGSTQGLRWLFWLIPFWLLTLPAGVPRIGSSRVWRTFGLVTLGFSVLSVGYAMRNPWTHPWILDALEHLNLYPLVR